MNWAEERNKFLNSKEGRQTFEQNSVKLPTDESQQRVRHSGQVKKEGGKSRGFPLELVQQIDTVKGLKMTREKTCLKLLHEAWICIKCRS